MDTEKNLQALIGLRAIIDDIIKGADKNIITKVDFNRYTPIREKGGQPGDPYNNGIVEYEHTGVATWRIIIETTEK